MKSRIYLDTAKGKPIHAMCYSQDKTWLLIVFDDDTYSCVGVDTEFDEYPTLADSAFSLAMEFIDEDLIKADFCTCAELQLLRTAERAANDINHAAGAPLYKRLTSEEVQAIADASLAWNLSTKA